MSNPTPATYSTRPRRTRRQRISVNAARSRARGAGDQRDADAGDEHERGGEPRGQRARPGSKNRSSAPSPSLAAAEDQVAVVVHARRRRSARRRARRPDRSTRRSGQSGSTGEGGFRPSDRRRSPRSGHRLGSQPLDLVDVRCDEWPLQIDPVADCSGPVRRRRERAPSRCACAAARQRPSGVERSGTGCVRR